MMSDVARQMLGQEVNWATTTTTTITTTTMQGDNGHYDRPP